MFFTVIEKWSKRLWERNRTFEFSSFFIQFRQVIEGLINTTSSYFSPFKNCVDKIDLESMNVLVEYSLLAHLNLFFFDNFLWNL